jgi:hypothetical protein
MLFILFSVQACTQLDIVTSYKIAIVCLEMPTNSGKVLNIAAASRTKAKDNH